MDDESSGKMNPQQKNVAEIAPLILVVDDHPENLAILEADLEEAGYRVALAESGLEALQRVAAERPELLLLDLSMPGIDGLEVCRRLRADTATADLPIIMVTGRDSPEDIVAGLDAGANDYVTKPIHPETMLARVRTQLRLKGLQDELKKTIQELEELQRLRADFVAMVTHDMKAPLTSVVGFSSMLLEKDLREFPLAEFRDALSNIHNNGRKLTQLINDFLTFSRIEAGRLEIAFEPVDLNLSLMQVIELLQYQADEKQVRIEYLPLESSPLRVRGDAPQIERAITNVLTNAIKYGPEGQPVRVRLGRQEDWVVIEIADRGPGIPKVLLPKLFDRYFRVRSPKKVEGTGLGLSIVKSIVEAHGGAVELETQPGQGTRVTLKFPVWKH